MTPSRRRRRICVVTGSRAEYGLLRTVMRALRRHPRLQLQVIATGMHLLPKFGRTIDEILADGWHVDARVPMQSGADDALDEAAALGRGVCGMAAAFRRLRSDVVVVLGDRIEAFAAAAAAACARLVVAHVHGGDRALGDVDDTLRHAITKLAHVHFVAASDAARRVRRLGEDPARIHRVGAPGLDEIRDTPAPTATWLRKTLGWPDVCDYALIAQHPCGRSPAIERRDMLATLRAVGDAGLAAVVTYPNSDPGHSGIVEAIEQIRRQSEKAEKRKSQKSERRMSPSSFSASPFFRFSVFPSLGRDAFLRLLKGARVLVGNSSAGIIESASAGVPAVNVGPRQKGRRRCGPSVIDCAYGRDAVRRAIAQARRVRVRSDKSVYGDGRAGPRIARHLAAIPLTEVFRRKLITY